MRMDSMGDSVEYEESPNECALDLRVNQSRKNERQHRSTTTTDPPSANGSNTTAESHSRCGSVTSRDGKSKRRNINIFKKHKLKYRYLQNKNKHSSDSGNFGSSSILGSSSTSTTGDSQKVSNDSTSSPCTSSSPSSGDSHSPQNFSNVSMPSTDPSMCMMLGNAVPLIVMMQGHLQGGGNQSNIMPHTTSAILFKCNMCSMFSNNMSDLLNHVNTNHANVHYCFVCNRFHGDKQEYDKHKDVCATAHQAFQQIIDGHYQGVHNTHSNRNNEPEQALNLSVAGNVAMRAAQIVHNKKGRKNKIKKLQKCTYCKKAFFGRFYLQRHLRSHTGEKLCHCNICGKGFAEWRNLRNHMSRFHNTSESNSSGGGQSGKSVSPNLTSDSDQARSRRPVYPKNKRNIESHINSAMTYPAAASNTTPNQSSIDITTAASTSSGVLASQSAPRNSLPSAKLCPIDVAAWSSASMQYGANNYNPMFTSSGMAETVTTGPAYTGAISQPVTTMVQPQSSNNETLYQVQSIEQKDTAGTQSHSGGGTSVTSSDKIKLLVFLGTTSSRLELSTGQQGHEESLNPVCNENGEKVFKCHMCSKVFRTKFAMQRHLDFHADKRPFECTQCDYKAKTKPQLKVHVMRHSGEKGFNCRICNYSCVTHSDLNRHCKSRSHLFRVNLMEQKDDEPEGAARGGSEAQQPPVSNHFQK